MAKLVISYCFAAFLILFSFQTVAQEIQVEGYFLKDSAKIGERVPYILKAKYGKGFNVVFPDSTYDYSPFEFLEKKTFISYTDEGVTLDSAVYYISNFSLDPITEFSLPVFQVFKYDSLEHRPLEASLALQLIIDEIPQEPIFQENNVYQPLETDFNYPLWSAVFIGILILSGLLMFFFGKSIQRQWQIYLEKRKYSRFTRRWEKAEQAFAANPDMEHADELLGLWKTYMEHLKNKPFRDWTTTEISEFLKNKEIIKDFREIEMIIYAGKEGKDLPQACKNLRNICTDTYNQKITTQDGRE
ncbi:hypothetical protein A33Q_3213 [Indibacter alkaliphilus LW1]|uniref:Oxygen tolerance n=1 Tax=Indibacter alkaliphilus (strain CCUG 57479 / KCTC 22604 / LW1) TaxID=1189612 RepID=S2DUS1_INDAL|nr:hypothetical protein [Indibacter alkaliphilus]EOZ95851.1 hypothetical protein A33Q_3213 [Indibacter alkaliphilus LW1]